VIDHTQAAADFSDPTTKPFWDAAGQQQLVIQQCGACGVHQFYPRSFCLSCDSSDVRWIRARGTGTVYSTTRVHLDLDPQLGLSSPYDIAIVELDEGPRLLTNLTEPCPIGTVVQVAWRARPHQPPVPVFGPLAARDGSCA
jgi:uncharacterized OB-fold protein